MALGQLVNEDEQIAPPSLVLLPRPQKTTETTEEEELTFEQIAQIIQKNITYFLNQSRVFQGASEIIDQRIDWGKSIIEALQYVKEQKKVGKKVRLPENFNIRELYGIVSVSRAGGLREYQIIEDAMRYLCSFEA